jgi:TRAP-type transport system periplasmic protein
MSNQRGEVSRREFLRRTLFGVGALGTMGLLGTACAPAAPAQTSASAGAGAASSAPTSAPSAPATGKAPEITLRYAGPVAGTDASSRAETVFKQKLEELSGGRIKVDVFTDASLGGPSELLDQVRAGTLAMALGAASWLQSVNPPFLAITLPYLWKDKASAFKVIDGPTGKKINAGFEQKGLKFLGWHDSGFRHVMNSKKPINTPADIAGMKIRLQANPAQLDTFKAFGAMPVSLDVKEIYSAAQQGVVDAIEYPLAAIIPNRFHEVVKYLSLTGHAFEVIGSYMGQATFDKLSPEFQGMVLAASKAELDWQRQETAKLEAQALDDLKAKGLAINQPSAEQLKQFADIAQPLYKNYEEKIGKDLLAEVRQAAGV